MKKYLFTSVLICVIVLNLSIVYQIRNDSSVGLKNIMRVAVAQSETIDISDFEEEDVDECTEETASFLKVPFLSKALANPPTCVPVYNKTKADCSADFTADTEGFVTFRGIRYKVGGANVKATLNFKNVDIDCPSGNTFVSCTVKDCTDFWGK